MASVRTARILAEVAAPGTAADQLCARLVTACARALPVTGVAMLLVTESGPMGTVAVTDGPAAQLEELQFALGEGPCVDASRRGRPVLQADLAVTGPLRWPGFTAGALEAGVRAVFALPLRVGAIRLGVLDLYRDEPGELLPEHLTEALHYADAATSLLLHLQSLDPDDGGHDGHHDGTVPVLEDRSEVHQATGVVSVQAEVTLPQALSLLRARAYAEARPVLDVARAVLRRELRFDDGDHGTPDGVAP